MKRLIAVVVLFVWIGIQIPAFAQSNGQAFYKQETLDAYITQQMEWGRIPGLALGIVSKDGAALIKGYGTAGNGVEVTEGTVFPIASVSKVFTALAARQMINAGILEEDGEVRTYLPGFSPTFRGQPARMRVHQLLTHTSGIAKIQGGAPYLYGESITLADIVERERNLILVRQPGTEYEYSNLNYLLLAAVLEAASGMTYEAYVGKHVLAPLQMAHTYLREGQIPQGDRTQGYTLLYGQPLRLPYPEPNALLPTGGIYTNAADLTRLLACYLENGWYLNQSILYAGNGKASDTGDVFDIYWVPGSDAQKELFHDGSMPEGTSSIRIDRQSGYAVVVLANANDQDQFFANGVSAGTIGQDVLYYAKTGTVPKRPAPEGAYARLALPAAMFGCLGGYVVYSAGAVCKRVKYPVAGVLADALLPLLALTAIPAYYNISWGLPTTRNSTVRYWVVRAYC